MYLLYVLIYDLYIWLYWLDFSTHLTEHRFLFLIINSLTYCCDGLDMNIHYNYHLGFAYMS